MTVEKIKYLLPGISDPALLEAMASEGQINDLQNGAVIMEPGQFIKSIPIVLEGAIKVLRLDEEGHELFLYHVKAGQTCALSLTCCNTSNPSEIKAIAEGDTTLLSIPAQYHEAWTERFRQWKDFTAMTYQARFQELLQTLDAVAFRKMDERLLSYLISRSGQLKTNILEITHQEIALELGTAREVVSRLLKQLEKKHLVELGRNKIYLRDGLGDVL